MADVLVATDAEWIYDEVDAALAGPDCRVGRVRSGFDVVPAVRALEPQLVVLDLQIGNMGGIATCTALRHEEGQDRIEAVQILLLLDRAADTFLAQEADADGWLIKPLDAFRLRKAAEVVLAGDTYFEGVDEPADA